MLVFNAVIESQKAELISIIPPIENVLDLGEIQNCSGNGFGVFFGSGTFEEELVI
jgi:hypothetical protein